MLSLPKISMGGLLQFAIYGIGAIILLGVFGPGAYAWINQNPLIATGAGIAIVAFYLQNSKKKNVNPYDVLRSFINDRRPGSWAVRLEMAEPDWVRVYCVAGADRCACRGDFQANQGTLHFLMLTNQGDLLERDDAVYTNEQMRDLLRPERSYLEVVKQANEIRARFDEAKTTEAV